VFFRLIWYKIVNNKGSDRVSEQASLPYGENVSLRELAIDTIIVGLRARYEYRAQKDPSKAERIPSEERLRKLARFVNKRSVRNGYDNHLGSAEPFA
jgi:hypothetical protein